MQCNAALCMCIVSLQCITDEWKKENEIKRRGEKNIERKAHKMQKKKRSSMKKGILWCVSVFWCAVGCIQIMTISRKTSALSQVITFFFIHRCLISTRFFLLRTTNENFVCLSLNFTQLPSDLYPEMKEIIEKICYKITQQSDVCFFWPNERKLHAVHSPSKWNCIHSEHDSHLEMFIVGYYLPKAHGYFENCLCKNDHRFTRTQYTIWMI